MCLAIGGIIRDVCDYSYINILVNYAINKMFVCISFGHIFTFNTFCWYELIASSTVLSTMVQLWVFNLKGLISPRWNLGWFRTRASPMWSDNSRHILGMFYNGWSDNDVTLPYVLCVTVPRHVNSRSNNDNVEFIGIIYGSIYFYFGFLDDH